MGAGQSKADQDEHERLDDVPIQFSQDVVNHLADTAASPEPTSARQSSIDAQIRARIDAEISRLQQEEQDIRRQIEVSLEKENLDRETKGVAVAHDGDDASSEEEEEEEGEHKALNSHVLLGDLEEVKQKVNRYQSKRAEVEQNPAGEAARALSNCYVNNASRPLECWKEVETFKARVAQLEQDYIASFR